LSIELELQQELEAAMRSRDKPRLDVIRQVRTEVSIKVAEPGFAGSIDDDLYRAVIGSYVKKMAKAKEEYDSLGERGAPMAAKLEFEISYLGRWLPRLLSEEETRSLVRQAISDLGADDEKMTGRVIGEVMKRHQGQVDGSLVSRVVREELADE